METTIMADALHWALMGAIHALPTDFLAFSQASAPVAMTALWQGTVLACGLALCLRLAPRASAAHRFLLWSTSFAALVSLPFLPLLLHFIAGVTAVSSGSAVNASIASGYWLQLDLRWSLVIGALWMVASLLRAADLGIHSLRLWGLWKRAVPVEQELPAATATLPGHRRIEVCTTKELDRPGVIGFFAPLILIPDWLFARLTREELEQVILHEAEHLRRRDDWTNLLQKLCLVLFPLNPALVWVEHRLCREREMACDDGVVRATRAPRAYAACLASLAEHGHERILERRAHALSLGAWQRRPELVQRVHRLLRNNPALNPLATRALLGALACGLILGAVEFARCPQLVAFVPEQSAAAQQVAFSTPHSDLHSDPHSDIEQPGQTRLLHAAYGIAAPRRIQNGAPEFRAAEAVAVLPMNREPSQSGARDHAESQHADAALIELRSNTSHSTLLKAEMPAPEEAGAPAQPGQTYPGESLPAQTQQWIVLATWEQRETVPAQASGQTPEMQSGASAAQRTGEAKGQPSDKPTSLTTITRLTLRVYPATSLPAGSAAAPISSGWFVFEL